VFGLSKKGEEQDGEDTKNDSNKRQSILSLHEAVEQKKAIIKEVTGHGFGSNVRDQYTHYRSIVLDDFLYFKRSFLFCLYC
jgi:protein-disulfide isomerase-like protein with CxxC motif